RSSARGRDRRCRGRRAGHPLGPRAAHPGPGLAPVSHDWLAIWRPVVHSWDGWLLTLILAGLVPFHGVLAYGRLKMVHGVIPTRRKLRLYGTIVAMEWGLVAATFAVAHHHGVGPRELGQTLGDARRSLSVTVLGLLGLLA